MANDKKKPVQKSELSSQDPVEGRRDLPSLKDETQPKRRKYDVDKVQKQEPSSEDDPTEDRRDVVHGRQR